MMDFRVRVLFALIPYREIETLELNLLINIREDTRYI